MSIRVYVGCQFVLHARCHFRLEKLSFLNVLIRAFVICQFWCTSISPCQYAKIRNLSIYGFGTCSVIESFSPVFNLFGFPFWKQSFSLSDKGKRCTLYITNRNFCLLTIQLFLFFQTYSFQSTGCFAGFQTRP